MSIEPPAHYGARSGSRRGSRYGRGLAAAAVLALAAWGPSASAAAQQQHPAKSYSPVVISHLMSSCGDMDDI